MAPRHLGRGHVKDDRPIAEQLSPANLFEDGHEEKKDTR